ncbi:MAG: hypothetical protein AAGC44_02035 [Planctomycetota bacterium]
MPKPTPLLYPGCTLMFVLLLALGCGEQAPPAPPAPGKGADAGASQVDNTRAGTGENINIKADATDNTNASPSDGELDLNVPETFPVHDKAGRSPFPQPGEVVQTLIPPDRLTDADPFGQAIDPDNIPDVVPWTQAAQYVGHEIVVEGKVVRLGKSSATNFLNFSADWRGKFYMVIFDDLATTLDGSVEATFRDKTVRVRGLVEAHRGTPQIKILSMDQVQFMD